MPWVLFVGGLVSVPCILIGANKLSQSWQWIAAYLGLPLLFISLCCCVIAPLLSSLSFGKRLACSAGALLAFAGVLFISLLVCAVVFGTGIR